MKIAAPIDRASEVQALIDAGADELYCGLVIGGRHFSIPRRPGDIRQYNVPTIKEFNVIVEAAQRHGVELFVTFNQNMLDGKQINTILKVLHSVAQRRIAGVIVSNFTLMEKLRKFDFKIVASSILEVKNAETVRMLREFNVRRIIFDRQITMHDITHTVRMFPDMEFEVFILNGGCRSLAGYCHPYLAAVNTQTYVHPCFYPSYVKPRDPHNTFLSEEKQQVLARRFRMPSVTCGICALLNFARGNITSLKIVGRGMATADKIRDIQLIRTALDILEREKEACDYQQKMRMLFKHTYKKDCGGELCYYPHVKDCY